METQLYVPAVTSFMSRSVCRPLNRAKSTVGVPLISETPVPLQSLEVKACIPEICTENEVTLAIGASAPITNEAPEGEDELPLLDIEPPLQPAKISEPKVRARSEESSSFL